MNQVSTFSLRKLSFRLSSSYFCCNVTGEAFVDGLLSTRLQMVNIIYIVWGAGQYGAERLNRTLCGGNLLSLGT